MRNDWSILLDYWIGRVAVGTPHSEARKYPHDPVIVVRVDRSSLHIVWPAPSAMMNAYLLLGDKTERWVHHPDALLIFRALLAMDTYRPRATLATVYRLRAIAEWLEARYGEGGDLDERESLFVPILQAGHDALEVDDPAAQLDAELAVLALDPGERTRFGDDLMMYHVLHGVRSRPIK